VVAGPGWNRGPSWPGPPQGSPAASREAPHYPVRQDRIDAGGRVTMRYVSKLRHIPVDAARRNRKVRLLVAGAEVRIVATDGTLIRRLTLDPSRI